MTGLIRKSAAFLLAAGFLGALLAGMFGAAFTAHAQSGTDCAVQDDSNSLSDLTRGELRPLAASYLIDPTGSMTADGAARESFTFTPCQGMFEVPRSLGALWLKFTARNPHAEQRTWGVSFMETVLDDVSLFEARGGELALIAQDGRTVPDAQSDNDRLQTSVSFRIQPGEEATYYVRVSGTYAPAVTPVIGSAGLLSDWSMVFSAVSVALLGFCVILAMFSLLLFRHIDVRFYQYYTAYLAAMFCMNFLYDGWPNMLFDATLSTTQWKPFIELASGLVMIAIIQYCRVLLTIDTDPGQRKQTVFSWLTGLGVIVTLWAMVDPLEMGTPAVILFIINPFVLLYVSGRRMLAGVKQAAPVFGSLLALTIGLLSSIYFFIFPIGVTPTHSVFEVIMMRPITLSYGISTFVEAVFMMIAISILITAIQRQRNAAVTEALQLRDRIETSEKELEEAVPATYSRVETLKALLVENPGKNAPAPASRGFLAAATRSVLDNMERRGFGARELASELGITEKTLGRRLKKSQGLAPAAFIRSVRLSYARDLILLNQYDTVAEIADASGFASVSHFAKLYRQEFKETPSAAIKSLPIAG